MMGDVGKHNYHVRIVNNYEDFPCPKVTEFVATDDESLDILLSAYCSFYSGDPVDVFINGEKAVLDKDWGLNKHIDTPSN